MARSSVWAAAAMLIMGLACAAADQPEAPDPCASADACCDTNLTTGALVPMEIPPGGSIREQIVYDADGKIYGCCGGGNWCLGVPDGAPKRGAKRRGHKRGNAGGGEDDGEDVPSVCEDGQQQCVDDVLSDCVAGAWKQVNFSALKGRACPCS